MINSSWGKCERTAVSGVHAIGLIKVRRARASGDQFAAFGFGKASRISAAVVRPPCSLTILLKKTTPCRSIKNVEGYAVSWGASQRRHRDL